MGLQIACNLRFTIARAIEEQVAFAAVAGEQSGAIELCARFRKAVEAEEQFATDAGQAMIFRERGIRCDAVDQLKAGCRPEGHGKGDGAVELDDGRGVSLSERGVKRGDASPVCLIAGARTGVAGGDLRLQYIGTRGCGELLGARQRSQSATDENLVPAAAVLIE